MHAYGLVANKIDLVRLLHHCCIHVGPDRLKIVLQLLADLLEGQFMTALRAVVASTLPVELLARFCI